MTTGTSEIVFTDYIRDQKNGRPTIFCPCLDLLNILAYLRDCWTGQQALLSPRISRHRQRSILAICRKKLDSRFPFRAPRFATCRGNENRLLHVAKVLPKHEFLNVAALGFLPVESGGKWRPGLRSWRKYRLGWRPGAMIMALLQATANRSGAGLHFIPARTPPASGIMWLAIL